MGTPGHTANLFMCFSEALVLLLLLSRTDKKRRQQCHNNHNHVLQEMTNANILPISEFSKWERTIRCFQEDFQPISHNFKGTYTYRSIHRMLHYIKHIFTFHNQVLAESSDAAICIQPFNGCFKRNAMNTWLKLQHP